MILLYLTPAQRSFFVKGRRKIQKVYLKRIYRKRIHNAMPKHEKNKTPERLTVNKPQHTTKRRRSTNPNKPMIRISKPIILVLKLP